MRTVQDTFLHFLLLLVCLNGVVSDAFAFAVLPFPTPVPSVAATATRPTSSTPTGLAATHAVQGAASISSGSGAAQPTASSVVLDPLSNRVNFSPGWEPVLSPDFPQQLLLIPETSDSGAFVDINLPSGTTQFDYVGFKSVGGASYVACVNCEAPIGGDLQFVDGHDPQANGTNTPSVLFSFSNLDASKNHTVTIFNLPDPRFNNQGSLNMVSCISTVLLANNVANPPSGGTSFSEPPATVVVPPSTIPPVQPPLTSSVAVSSNGASSAGSSTSIQFTSSSSATTTSSSTVSEISTTASSATTAVSRTSTSSNASSSSSSSNQSTAQTSSTSATSSAATASGTNGNGSGNGGSGSGAGAGSNSGASRSGLSPVLIVVIVVLSLLALISLLFGLWVIIRARRANAADLRGTESGRPPSDIIMFNSSTEVVPPQSQTFSDLNMEGFIPYRPPVSIPQDGGVPRPGVAPSTYSANLAPGPHPYASRQLTQTGLPTGPRNRAADLQIDTAAAAYGSRPDARRRYSYQSQSTASEYSQDHMQDHQDRSNPFKDRNGSDHDDSLSQSSYDPILTKATTDRHPYGTLGGSGASYALQVANSTSADKLQINSNNSSAERLGPGGSTWLTRIPRTPI